MVCKPHAATAALRHLSFHEHVRKSPDMLWPGGLDFEFLLTFPAAGLCVCALWTSLSRNCNRHMQADDKCTDVSTAYTAVSARTATAEARMEFVPG